jgi:predicted ATPase
MGDADDTLRFGPYTLHRVQGLMRGAQEVRVTQKALRVLWTLALRAGETVTKDELFREVWRDVAVSDAALTTCIQELRRALGDVAQRPAFIETRHRQGFRFVAQTQPAVTEASKPAAPLASALCVGREREIEILRSALANTRAGARQLVVIRGESGIGKSTLLRTFVDGLAADATMAVSGATCAEAIGGCEPYRPLLDSVSMFCTRSRLDRDAALLRRHAPSWWAQFPGLHVVTDQSPMPAGGVTSTRMSRELTDYIETLATTQAVLLWIDDVQWADAATLDWLSSFMARVQFARVMLIVALRDDRQTLSHAVLTQLSTTPSCHAVTLSGLELSAVADVVRRRRGDGPDVMKLASRLHARTEGHALFVSLLAETLTGGGLVALQATSQAGAADPDRAESQRPLSERLRAVINAQIAYLDPAEIELLEVASLIGGTDWPAALVAAAAEQPLLDVEAALARLARRSTFIQQVGPARWPDGTRCETFAFRHALHRDVFRERVAAHRKAVHHARIGNRLEAAFGQRTREHALALAVYFEEAGQGDKAVAYLLEAASAADRLGSVRDAAQLLEHALAVLSLQPPSRDRDEREAEIQARLGAALMAAQGWGAPDAERAYTRALDLCELRHDTVPVSYLLGLVAVSVGPRRAG